MNVTDVPKSVVTQIIGELIQGTITSQYTSECEHGIKTYGDGYLITNKFETIRATVTRWQCMIRDGRIISNLDFTPEDGMIEYIKNDRTWTTIDRVQAWDKIFNDLGEENWVRKIEEMMIGEEQ